MRNDRLNRAWDQRPLSRRQAIERMGAGFGGLALATLLAEQSAAAENPLSQRPAHFPPKVKRVIMLFMFGGPSHLDTFDPKPLLSRDSGRPLPAEQRPRVLSFPNRMGNLVGSAFPFQRYGESGLPISSLFPNLARCADDLCVINSMHCSNSRHGGAVLEWHTGSDTFVRPSFGSWVTYGLGSENQNFPGYVTDLPGPLARRGEQLRLGLLAGRVPGHDALGYAGEKPREARIPFIGNGTSRRDLQRLELDLIAIMDRRNAQNREPETELDAYLVVRAFICRVASGRSRNARDRRRISGNLLALRSRRALDR